MIFEFFSILLSLGGANNYASISIGVVIIGIITTIIHRQFVCSFIAPLLKSGTRNG